MYSVNQQMRTHTVFMEHDKIKCTSSRMGPHNFNACMTRKQRHLLGDHKKT